MMQVIAAIANLIVSALSLTLLGIPIYVYMLLDLLVAAVIASVSGRGET